MQLAREKYSRENLLQLTLITSHVGRHIYIVRIWRIQD